MLIDFHMNMNVTIITFLYYPYGPVGSVKHRLHVIIDLINAVTTNRFLRYTPHNYIPTYLLHSTAYKLCIRIIIPVQYRVTFCNFYPAIACVLLRT